MYSIANPLRFKLYSLQQQAKTIRGDKRGYRF
jgi:hypothetical protein